MRSASGTRTPSLASRRRSHDYAEVPRLKKPDCRTDGLAPFVLKRLIRCRPAIEKAGPPHPLRHRPGTAQHRLVPAGPHRVPAGRENRTRRRSTSCWTIVTEYLVDWIGLQADTLDSIDGIFLLDDLIGFLRDDDFQEFALPYLKRIYDSRRCPSSSCTTTPHGLVTARHLAAMGVNLFNFSFNHSLAEMRREGRAKAWCCWATFHPATCWRPVRPTTFARPQRRPWPALPTGGGSSSPAAAASRPACRVQTWTHCARRPEVILRTVANEPFNTDPKQRNLG